MSNKFGFKDVIGIIVSLIVFILGMKFIPDQGWLSQSVWAMFLFRLVFSFILATLVYIGLTKILIPSDTEISNFERNAKIKNGLKAIRDFGTKIQSQSTSINPQHQKTLFGVGTTIYNIAAKLDPADTNKENSLFIDSKGSLVEITKLQSKLSIFVNYLAIVVGLETGKLKTTSEKRVRVFSTFYSQVLPQMQSAMDNLEIILDNDDVSPAVALSNTLEDLLQMDGLIDNSDLKGVTK